MLENRFLLDVILEMITIFHYTDIPCFQNVFLITKLSACDHGCLHYLNEIILIVYKFSALNTFVYILLSLFFTKV